MTKKSKSEAPAPNGVVAKPTTLATVLAALEQPGGLSTTRLRDLRSAVKRVADLLGDEPAGVPLDIGAIGSKLGAISPIAASMTAKRFANIRSDFLAALKASGLMPVKVEVKKTLSPAWAELFARLSGRRAHIGLSRLAGLCERPGNRADRHQRRGRLTALSPQFAKGPFTRIRGPCIDKTTLIWNEAARDPKLGLPPVTVASFRGPPQRIEWSVLPASFRRDVDDYLCWAGQSDPFAADARLRALAPKTLHLRRDYIHAAVSALVETGTKPASILFARRPRHTPQLQKHSATSSRDRGRPGKRLQSRPRHNARSDCARMGEGRRLCPRRAQTAGRQVAGADRGPNRQEQAVLAAVR